MYGIEIQDLMADIIVSFITYLILDYCKLFFCVIWGEISMNLQVTFFHIVAMDGDLS